MFQAQVAHALSHITPNLFKILINFSIGQKTKSYNHASCIGFQQLKQVVFSVAFVTF